MFQLLEANQLTKYDGYSSYTVHSAPAGVEAAGWKSPWTAIARQVRQAPYINSINQAAWCRISKVWKVVKINLIVTFLTIAFWRSVEDPLEVDVQSVEGNFLLWGIGCGVMVILQVGLRHVTLGYHYLWVTYLYASASVLQTSGLWILLDTPIWSKAIDSTVQVVAPTFILSLFGCIVNIPAAPFFVEADTPHEKFHAPTVFQTAEIGWPLGALEMTLYVLDCIFSVFVIGSLVVFVWRGAWTLLDLFLFPEDESFSAFCSLIIGYGIVVATFALQSPMKRLCEWLTGFWRIAALDLYVLFSFSGTINLWRGFWMILHIYFLPDAPLWSYVLSHIFPFILLVLLNCSNSLLVRGVFIDGDENGGKCVDFPTYYLRMFFQEQRKKKLLKQSQRMRISTLANKAEEFEKSEKSMAAMNDVGKGHVVVDVAHVTRF